MNNLYYKITFMNICEQKSNLNIEVRLKSDKSFFLRVNALPA